LPVLVEVLTRCGEDKLIPHIVWQNLHPLLEHQHSRFVKLITRAAEADQPGPARMMPHAVERILAAQAEPATVAALLVALFDGGGTSREAASRCLKLLAEQMFNRELDGERLEAMRDALEAPTQAILKKGIDDPLAFDAALVAASWANHEARALLRAIVTSDRPPDQRLAALKALIAGTDGAALPLAIELLSSQAKAPPELQAGVLGALGRLDADPFVGKSVARAYDRLSDEQKPKAIELLTQRPAWSKDLLAAIGKGEIPASALNANQVRKLLESDDPELVAAVQKHWGSIRTERDPKREEVLASMRDFLRKNAGDPHRGREAFMKVCGQCHKMYGQGEEVGPDITSNGRGNLEQLLSNVFDPSLVIGAAYQAHTVITADGRVLTGLLTEDSPQRVVLKTQGGKLETVPRDQVDEMLISKLSLMPEGVENQLKPEELADLFAFLVLDRPPEDPEAKPIPAK
jgi:putative heme-binding domain-containing protein